LNHLEELRAISKRISLLKPTNTTELSLLSLFIGALYGLNKSITLNYTNRTGENLPPNYIDELKIVASQLAGGKVVDIQEWLAGFYHNSALHRLNVLNERINKYVYGNRHQAEKERINEKKVRPIVNKMKHNVNGVLDTESVEISEAVALLLQLESLLNYKMT